MTLFGQVLIAGLGMTVIALSGALTLLLSPKTVERLITPLVAFAAGTLLGGALLHLQPAAFTAGLDPAAAGLYTLAGFTLFLLLERVIQRHRHHRAVIGPRPLTYLILLGDGVHNFLGGLAIGAGEAKGEPGTIQSLARSAREATMIERRPTKTELAAAAGKTVPDVIAPGLAVLFCGINPGLYSAATRHHFARPGNRFWPALQAAGFTDHLMRPWEEQRLLEHSVGITNLVRRATATAAELAPDELRKGRVALERKVRRYRPRAVAVLGIGAYRVAFQRPEARLGQQPERVGGTVLWLLPNPSGLNAHHQLTDLAREFRTLREFATPSDNALRLVTLGVGAQASPRYAPAGLLVEQAGVRVMIDGGPGAAPSGTLAAWLVTDMRSELMPRIRELAGAKGLEPYAGPFRAKGLVIECRPVIHTSHPAFGYLIRACGARVVWAPEFFEFPVWARGATLMFAEAAGWNRPIRFRGGVGGHLDAVAVAEAAHRRGVRRLVFAHIGRPMLRAIDQGKMPPFGEIGADGRRYVLGGRARVSPSPSKVTSPSAVS